MALTIQSTPVSLSSLHDDIIFTVKESVKTADPTTYPNYQFVCDVYVGTELVARLKKKQAPVTGVGIFNISPILRNYVEASFDPNAGLVAQELGEGQFKLTATVKFGEEYGFVTYPDVTVDTARVYFNHYHARKVLVLTELHFLLNEVASDRLYFTANLNSQKLFAPYFPSSTSSVSVTVTPYGGGIPYAGSFAPSEAYNMQILNVSPTTFNSLQAGTITANTLYYTLVIGSQTYRVNMICEPLYDLVPLHFLSKWGGYETMLFSKVSKTSFSIDKKDFGKLPYTVDGAGFVSYRTENGVYKENRATYSSHFEEKMTINTDFLTDNDYRWLSQLVISPLVYIEDQGSLFPVIIKKTNYELNKAVVDDLTNLTLELEFGTTHNAQYR